MPKHILLIASFSLFHLTSCTTEADRYKMEESILDSTSRPWGGGGMGRSLEPLIDRQEERPLEHTLESPWQGGMIGRTLE